MRKKISVIGAGNVGATCVQRIAEKGYADVVMLDIIEGLPQGKALDMMESAPVLGFDAKVTGTNDYKDTANSDVVVITSGLPRKPGMTRDELLQANMKIVGEVTRNVVKHSPNCILVLVTNPLDAMVYLAYKVSGLPASKVLGLSGALDATRLRYFIAEELKVSVEDVYACVVGEHGKNMVVIPRLCTVDGVPVTTLLPKDTIDRLIERTIGAGAEIVGYLKTGSAFYAPSAGVAHMVDAIMMDKKQVVQSAVVLQGEYGIKDSVISVPVKLGSKGVDEVVEMELTPEEKQALASSAEAVKGLIKAMDLK